MVRSRFMAQMEQLNTELIVMGHPVRKRSGKSCKCA